MNTLVLASLWQGILAFLLVSVSLLLIGIVLLQKNRGGGLSGAFGGVGGHSAFGTKTGDFLTWVTVGMTAAFFLLAIAANYAFQPESSEAITGTPAVPTLPPTETIPPPPTGEAPAGSADQPPATPPSPEGQTFPAPPIGESGTPPTGAQQGADAAPPTQPPAEPNPAPTESKSP